MAGYGNWNNQWSQQQQQQPAQQQQQKPQWNQATQQKSWEGWPQQQAQAGQTESWQQPKVAKQPGLVQPKLGKGQALQPQAASDTLIVSTGGKDMDEVVIRTLVGEYKENGNNHDRKVYKKVITPSSGEAVDVYLYYWDERDGDAFAGWWFGNQLGGTQVWSHVKAGTMVPPPSGWKIPWDGAVRPSISVVNKAQAVIREAQANKAEVQAKVAAISEEITMAQGTAQTALEQARVLAGDMESSEGIIQAEELLAPQVSLLTMANKKLMESQKGSAGEVLKGIQALSQTLRSTHAAVNSELGKLRAKKLKVEKEEKQRGLEEKDMALFQELIPEALAKTNAAEDAVEKAAITAEMITAGDDDLESVRQAVDETEKSAREAQTSIGEARIFLNAKLASSKRFESERVRAEAMEELGKLQAQLQAAQTKLTPLKTARQDFIQRTAAKKLVDELQAKLTPAEVDVDKAEEVTNLMHQEAEITKESLAQAESAVSKANDRLQVAVKFIETKKKAMPAQGLVRDELMKMEERVQTSTRKLADLKASFKDAAERISSSTLTEEAAEKLVAVQEAVAKVADAEGPFLMGLEELPLDETLTAVKACETAATSANTSVSIARMFIATKLVEVKRFTADTSKVAQAKLTEYQKQLEALTHRLSELKKSTATRKKSALMRESEGCVTKAEELSQKVAEIAACFQDDSKLMELTSDEIRTAGTETAKAETAANAALAEARKFITARQIEAKGKDASEEVSQMLIKYQTRLSSAQTEVSKFKKLSSTVEVRLAAKKAVEDATNKVVGAEEKVKTACDLVTELEESTPEGMGEKAHQEAIKAAEDASAAASAALKQVDRYLSSQTRVSATAKEEIAKLVPRVKEAQDKLEESQNKIKEASEKAAVQGIILESEKRVIEAEDGVAKAKEAELPFIGGKDMSAEESTVAFQALEAAAQAAHSAVGGTKTFLAMKRLAAKRLVESAAKTTTAELAKLQTRLDDTSKKLQEVRKGLAERKAGQVVKEMAAKVEAVEKKVAEATEATTALEDIEGSATFSAEKAKAECEKLATTEKEAQKLMDDALNFLVERKKDIKGAEKDTEGFGARLNTAQTELAKSKRALSEFEQRFVAQKLLSEANTMVADLEAEIEKATASAAPLLEEGGTSFLAATTVGAISEALNEHMQKTSSSKETIFREAGGTDGGKIGKDAFLAYLEKLPEKLANEDIAFPEDQKDSLFNYIDVDKDGEISMEDFTQMFAIRYMCVQSISITDGFEIAKSKTVLKLELDDMVELTGEQRVNEANGVTRIECKAVESGKAGWVTTKGNQGTVYLEPFSPYNSFLKAIERQIDAAGKSSSKTSSFIKTKSAALANTPKGPLADARADLTKMKPRITEAQKASEQLRRKILDAKKEYVKKQEEAREARDRKAAALLMKGIEDKVKIMDASAQKLADAAKPLVSASGSAQLLAIATPLTISTEVEKITAELRKDCAAVREAIAEQKQAVAKAEKGPMQKVKQELSKYTTKADATEKKCGSTSDSIRKACASLATEQLAKASSALRKSLQKAAVGIDLFFRDLARGQEKMSAEAFSKCLRGLEGLNFPEEHLTLIGQRIGGDDGISRRSFEQLVQQFYKCVKAIAITNEFGISKSKNVRMMELGEVIEVIEGPTADEKLGIQRVKGKALTDGASGWISMKGNQGTPFLMEVQKPCYYCVADIPLDKEFMNANGEPPIRTLKTEEVIEVVEGPRKESFQGSHRAKARASKDGAVGWFVMKTKDGVSNVEQSGQFYICTANIAMTDAKDIKTCKVLRKLEPKEVVKVIDGPTDPDEAGVQRIHCQSLKDQSEGWITIKGNKGTVYAEETSKLYTLLNSTALHKKFETDGAVLVRTLEKGEAIEVTDGPKEEKFEVTRLKGRALSDGSVGWVSVKAATVKPWSTYYKCTAETELTAAVKSGSEVVRKLEKDELAEAIDGPKEEDGVMRIKVRIEKDGAAGWATLKSAEGTVFLRHKDKASDK